MAEHGRAGNTHTEGTGEADRLLRSVNLLLNRYLIEGADGAPRPLRYNPVDYQALRRIHAGPGARATDIARDLRVPATTLQSSLDRMGGMGLLEKSPHPTDGRARVYALTKAGEAMHAAILAQDRANMGAMLDVLEAEERGVLLDLLDRIAEALRQQGAQ